MSKTFLLVSAQYLPTAGGVERYTNCLAKKLIGQGHKVIVATSSLEGLPDHETDPDGIEIIRFPSIPFMNGRLPLLRPGGKFQKAAKLLWDRQIDHCLINTYFYPLSMYAASCIYRKRIPAILINHGSAWLMTGNPILQFAGRIYERMAVSVCRHYCVRFFGVSSAARDWMKTFSISPEGIITNAIDPDAVLTAGSGLDWRARLSLPESAKLIAFVGRMIPEKGVEPMIAAMAQIRQVYPDAYLVMAGSGPLLEHYQKTSTEGVILLGVQPYPDVLALLSQADVFCLPSRSEGFACTVLEAAALGCPVITTATGDSPQLLINEQYGTILPDQSPAAISSACNQALGNPAWRKTAAQLTNQRLRERYTWDASLQQLLDAFQLPTT